LSLVVTGLNTSAAPPNRMDLPSELTWALHVDCDALRKAYIGKYFLYQLDKPEMYSNMVAFQSIFSFDLRTQLHGVTVYGGGGGLNDCVTIVYGEFNPEKLTATLRQTQHASRTTAGKHVIYSWTEKGQNAFAVVQSNRVIKCQNERSLADAMAVIDGLASNLSNSRNLPELSPMPGGTFIQGVARKTDFLDSNPNTILFKMSKRVKVKVSEEDEQFKGVITLEAADENAARQISMAGQGMMALLSLQRNDPNLGKTINAISVKQEGRTVTLSLMEPSVDLISILKASADKNATQDAAVK